MKLDTHILTILLPPLFGAIGWLTSTIIERKKHKAELNALNIKNVGSQKNNDRVEIDNLKVIASEWREAAQQWKSLADEYQIKLIENSHKIEELTKEVAILKGQLIISNNRIKELESRA